MSTSEFKQNTGTADNLNAALGLLGVLRTLGNLSKHAQGSLGVHSSSPVEEVKTGVRNAFGLGLGQQPSQRGFSAPTCSIPSPSGRVPA